MLKRTLVCTLASLSLLVGCGPQRNETQELAQAELEVKAVGQPFEVDGCTVQTHRVFVTGRMPNFTLATAKCPTATVRATENSCGKNCTDSAIQVVPMPPERTLVSKEAVERAQLKEDLEQTREELARLKEKLDRMSRSGP